MHVSSSTCRVALHMKADTEQYMCSRHLIQSEQWQNGAGRRTFFREMAGRTCERGRRWRQTCADRKTLYIGAFCDAFKAAGYFYDSARREWEYRRQLGPPTLHHWALTPPARSHDCSETLSRPHRGKLAPNATRPASNSHLSVHTEIRQRPERHGEVGKP